MKAITSHAMRKTILLLSLLLGLLAVQAQRPRPQQPPPRERIKERVESQEIAFITRELNLSPAEAKEFWPVYEAFKEKRKEIAKQYREKFGTALSEDKTYSEAEYKEFADNQIIEEQRLLDLKKEYHGKFLSVLPASKVVRLYQAERKFKRMLLERLKNRGPGGRQGERPE